MGGLRYAAPEALRGWKEAAWSSAAWSSAAWGSAVGGERGGERVAQGTLLRLDFGAGLAELALAADGSVRLRAWRVGSSISYPEHGLVRGPFRPVPASTRPRGGGRLDFGGPHGPLALEVDASPFQIRTRDRQRRIVWQLRELCFANNGATRISLDVDAGDRFYGFGGQAGPLEKRGQQIPTRDRRPLRRAGHARNALVPYCLVHRGQAQGPGCYGVLLDSPDHGPDGFYFDVAATRPDRVVIESDRGLDLIFFPGPSPREVTERLTARVGRTPLPPLWALGHHVSQTRSSEDRIRRLARRLIEEDLPADAIHLDASHLDDLRAFSWHPRRFPDPAGLVASLAKQGLRLVNALGPGIEVDPESPLFAGGSAHDVFRKRSDGSPVSFSSSRGERLLPDFDRAEVRAWWGRLHAPLVEVGVSGIWNDAGAPASWPSRWRGGTSLDVAQAPVDEPGGQAARASLHHLEGLQKSRASRDALDQLARARRSFVLADTAATGLQRYAALCPRGSRSRFRDLRAEIVRLLGLGSSGIAFCGFEIGGSLGVCSPELYARWMQVGALAPLALTRPGAFTRGREPWRFDAEVRAIARAALHLRMRLLPYFYALLRHSERSGVPIWRSLASEFPKDAEAARIDDQIMIGSALLAAPVLSRGEREREVYLPAGDWIDWHDGARYAGARCVQISAPLERIPLFARGGSVLPTQSPVRNALEVPAEPLVLEVFPGGDTSFELVEDDGESVAYQGSVVARTALRLWNRAGGRLRLELARREGSYSIAPRPLRICVNACPSPNAVYLDGSPLPRGVDAPSWRRDPEGRLHVQLHDVGAGCAIEVDPAP